MWNTQIFGFDTFVLYAYFMLYSFLGWAMESAFVSVSNKKWVNRGFISGPFCPIYGTGAVLIIIFLTPVTGSALRLFLGGMLIATVVEYAIAAILERLFHATWWDYSHMRFQIKGRVCLRRSVEWGLLSMVLMWEIQPRIAAFVAQIPRTIGEYIGVALLMYIIADTSVTVSNVLRLREKLAHLNEVGQQLRERLESIGYIEAKKEFAAHMEALPVAEALRELRARLDEEAAQFNELREEERLRREYLLAELKEKLENRASAIKRSNLTERRLAKAFPKLKFEKFNEEFTAFRKELENRKK